MNQDQLYKQATNDEHITPIVQKANQDLIVLRYMAQQVRVHTILQAQVPGQTASASLPWLYSLNERQRRSHRIAIYQPQPLLQKQDLAFVGFVSERHHAADSKVVDRLNAVDQDMLSELVHVPGLLSYSSLELRTGNWYNLVILQSLAAKSHFHTIGIHRYAAYELSPHYYAWIRLHRGSLRGGLSCGKLLLRGTKYYTFPGNGQSPLMQEQVYVSC